MLDTRNQTYKFLICLNHEDIIKNCVTSKSEPTAMGRANI